MNKKFMAAALSLAMVMTGCTSGAANEDVKAVNQVDSDQSEALVIDSTDTVENAETNVESNNEKDFIDVSLELLGLDDELSAEYFGGGEQNYTSGGDYLIGRIFKVNALGVDTELSTSYDNDGVINSMNVHLGEDNFDAMNAVLTAKLGEPTEVEDTPSEGGSTYVMWDVGGKLIYLYNGYGTVDLQFILPMQPIVPVMAEMEPYPELKQLIIDTYEIPEDYWARTKYYYNYVDLNADGHNEIFVVVMGPYTSGSGGSSAMIVYPVENNLYINQQFTLVQTPVIISDTMTKGAKEIIMYRSGGGAEATYVKLIANDAEYQNVNDGTPIDSLDGITGRAIISNDILKDMENGTYLTLE